MTCTHGTSVLLPRSSQGQPPSWHKQTEPALPSTLPSTLAAAQGAGGARCAKARAVIPQAQARGRGAAGAGAGAGKGLPRRPQENVHQRQLRQSLRHQGRLRSWGYHCASAACRVRDYLPPAPGCCGGAFVRANAGPFSGAPHTRNRHGSCLSSTGWRPVPQKPRKIEQQPSGVTLGNRRATPSTRCCWWTATMCFGPLCRKEITQELL